MNESPSTPGDASADSAPESSPALPTAGEVIDQADKRSLEEKIAELEKKYGDEKKSRENLEHQISKTRKVSSARLPGKSLLDELNEFWEGK